MTSPSVSKIVRAFDAWQQKRVVVAFPLAVAKRSSDTRAGRLAALMAYYGFLSAFPALLVMVTALGFVLDRRPDLRMRITDSVLSQFPIVGDSVAASAPSPLEGNRLALGIGLVAAIWAGLKAMQASQDAMNELWEVPVSSQPGFFTKRLRSLLMLGLLGVLMLCTTAFSQAPSLIGSARPWAVLLAFLTVLVNIGTFEVAFRVLTVSSVSWRQHLPGACIAGSAYSALQLAGGAYVRHVLAGAQRTYGAFAAIIGLTSWIYLISFVAVTSAQVNVVAARCLWPRSLLK